MPSILEKKQEWQFTEILEISSQSDPIQWYAWLCAIEMCIGIIEQLWYSN